MAEKTVNRAYEGGVRRVLERLMDERLTRLRPIPSFPDSIVYEGASADTALVLKLIDPDGQDESRIAAEAWALRRAARAGVPVPAVVDVDASATELPATFMVMAKARGVDLRGAALSDEQMRPLLLEIGRNLRKLHSVEVDGFGFLRVDSAGNCRGEHANWKGAALAAVEPGLAKLAANPHFTQANIPLAERIISENAHILESVERGSLLHGDLGMIHLFADLKRRKITSFIDFGECKSGDPVWDFVDVRWRHVNTILEGYAPVERMRAEFDDRFYLCAILRNLIWTVRWNDVIPRDSAERMAFMIGEAAQHFGYGGQYDGD